MCCIKFVTLFDIILALLGTIVYAFIGVSEAATISFGSDDIPTEVETRSQSRRRRTVVKGRLVPFAGSVPMPLAVPAANVFEGSWKGHSTMVCITSAGDISVVFHYWSSFLVVVVSDHFSTDPVVTPIRAAGHQLVTFCCSICADERAQILAPLTSSKFCRRTVLVCSVVCVLRLFGCLED